ncbi:Oxysterol-binding protein-domain-containing protein [Zopfochytrium polystomum]|nr:Oxysterol-binding protein-domain-containing protein [Zopfochytrium polystomum]
MFFDAEEGESDVDESDSSSFGADDDDYRYSAEEEFEDDVAPFDDDEDEEEGQGPVIDKTTGKESNEAILVTSVPVSPSDVKPNPDDHATENPADGTPPEPPKYAQPVVRRKTLPAPTTSMENISIMSLLRNNVGKDLSTVAMPILLNEPINLLQKLAEELEYCELLQEANNAADPADRIALIAAFAVSGYSSSVNRPGRKPFNPLLGETYECLREDKGFRYISEKVSHHPPIMACHADSDAYTFYQDNLLKSKFWGKSMELIPSGSVHVQLKSTGELYVWNKVTTCMRNIFSTGRYLEHYGVMKITCAESGLTAQLSFKESGYFVSAKNEITGSVLSASGQELFQLSGKWDEGLYRFHSSSPNNLEVLWRARPCPPHHSQMYGFTAFTVELNDLTPDLIGVLPNTDTRYRPDQRMYEEGRVDDAEKEKQRLEQKQREYRKRLEAEGKRWEPQFFELKPNEGGGEATWTYRGGYWEKREKRAFEPQLDLFS